MLKKPILNKVVLLASKLQILSQDTNALAEFILNAEQITILHSLLNKDKTLIVKARQMGSSTISLFYLALMSVINPNISIGVIVDSHPKASDFLDRIYEFLVQLGVRVESKNTKRITLSNKTTINALSAGKSTAGEESNVGRSATHHLLLISEFPYFATPGKILNSLLNSSPNAQIIIESTAKMPADKFHNLFTEDNDYDKIFFGVEDHASYTLSPDTITDAEWEDLQKEYGFTSRPHAAWWYRKLINQGNDIISHLRDYPVVPEHSFAMSEGRWIMIDSKVIKESIEGQPCILIKQIPNRKYVYGVDTSAGRGRDASAITIIDPHTKQLVATWYSTTAEMDTTKQILINFTKQYSPYIIKVETNGIGEGLYQNLKGTGLPISQHSTNKANAYDNLLMVKRAIESGKLKGETRLLEEVRSIQRKDDKFIGKKDMLMALSFAYPVACTNIPRTEITYKQNQYNPNLYPNHY